jgi:hypothetical protein
MLVCRSEMSAYCFDRAGDVIHCNGHGSAGSALSCGCTDDVLTLAR